MILKLPSRPWSRQQGLFFQYVTFDVSEEMLNKLPAECDRTGRLFARFPFDDFMRSCMRHRIPLPITESALELIIRRSSFNTIDIFLEGHPDIQITGKHIEAGENNPMNDIDKDALMSLLHSKLISS